MIAWLSGALEPYGVRIGAVAVGIAIQEGIDKLTALNIDVSATQVFDDVEDELCERDFAVVSGSGRRIAQLEANALYFDVDFGRPNQWASIPDEYAREFCAVSLERNIRLLNPTASMVNLSRFLGYSSTGKVVEALGKRVESLQ